MIKKLLVLVGLTYLGWVSWNYLFSDLPVEGQQTTNICFGVAVLIMALLRLNKRLMSNILSVSAIALAGVWLTYTPFSAESVPSWVTHYAQIFGASADKCEKAVFLSALATLILSMNFLLDIIIDPMQKRTRGAGKMLLSQSLIPIMLAWQINSIFIVKYSSDDKFSQTLSSAVKALGALGTRKVPKAIPVSLNSFHERMLAEKENRVSQSSKSLELKYVTPDFDVRTMHEVSGDKLDKILGGVLRGKGHVFVEAGRKHGVSPIFLASIAIHESGNGTSDAARDKRHNPVGALVEGKYHRSFDCVEDAIEFMANSLENSSHYLRRGNYTVGQIQKVYCPVGAKNDPKGLNKHWLGGVVDWMNKICAQAAGNAQTVAVK